MRTLLAATLLVITYVELGSCQRGAPPVSLLNPLQTCTADTPGNEWVRRGNHLRRRGDCQLGYYCDGNEIKEYRAPCREPSYLSVHTGTCSFPNIYAYVFGSFNCTAEEDDPNLDFDSLTAKRDEICRPLIEQAGDDTTELYVGDPDDCQLMFKCPLVAVHDDWLHRCTPGMRFQAGEEGPCVPDNEGCAFRDRPGRGK